MDDFREFLESSIDSEIRELRRRFKALPTSPNVDARVKGRWRSGEELALTVENPVAVFNLEGDTPSPGI